VNVLGSSGSILLSLSPSQAERWFIVASGLSFLGLLGVGFFFAAVRPSAMYPSPFWPSPRIAQFVGENSADVRALGAVQTLIALSFLSFGTIGHGAAPRGRR
jgi:hypothetical protein